MLPLTTLTNPNPNTATNLYQIYTLTYTHTHSHTHTHKHTHTLTHTLTHTHKLTKLSYPIPNHPNTTVTTSTLHSYPLLSYSPYPLPF